MNLSISKGSGIFFKWPGNIQRKWINEWRRSTSSLDGKIFIVFNFSNLCSFVGVMDETFFRVCFAQIVSGFGASVILLYINMTVMICLKMFIITSLMYNFVLQMFYIPAIFLIITFFLSFSWEYWKWIWFFNWKIFFFLFGSLSKHKTHWDTHVWCCLANYAVKKANFQPTKIKQSVHITIFLLQIYSC